MRHDDLNSGNTFSLMNVDGYASAVVCYAERLVGMKSHFNFGAIASDDFINTVIDDFLGKVIGILDLGVHPRSLANGVKPNQDFNRGSVVDSSQVTCET